MSGWLLRLGCLQYILSWMCQLLNPVRSRAGSVQQIFSSPAKNMEQYRLVYANTISFKSRANTGAHSQTHSIYIHCIIIYEVSMCTCVGTVQPGGYMSFPPGLATDPKEHTKPGDRRPRPPAAPLTEHKEQGTAYH